MDTKVEVIKMLDKTQRRSPGKTILFLAALILFLLFWMSVTTFGQSTDNSQTTAVAQTVSGEKSKTALKPVLLSYKEVTIGMTADEVRDKLGKPEVGDDQGVYYKFNDEESVQITLDSDKKVRVISMMYFNKNDKAPKAADIFGPDVEVTPNTDGSIYHLLRYPEAGYLVIYSRTAGDDATVVVTMQKI
jgi:hypothetical protein